MTVKLKQTLALGALASIGFASLTGCAVNESSAAENGSGDSTTLEGSLVGAGASSQGEAQNAWIASFGEIQQGIDLTYDPAGSGTGRENFQQGATQYAGSDRAFTLDEIEAGPFEMCAADSDIVQLPLYISPIAVIFNLDGIDTLNLDADTIAKIFTGEIASWNDAAIAEANPDVDLPALKISPVHRADKSGTTGNFTSYLAEAAPESWSHGEVEEWPLERGEAAPQTSGMVSAVEGGEGTIGYADASRAAGFGTVSVKVGDAYVPYSPEAAAAVVDASELETGRSDADLAFALDRTTTAEGVYPIVLVSYLVGCETYAEAESAALVKEFFSFVASEEGQRIASENAGSAPISDELRDTINTAIDTIN